MSILVRLFSSALLFAFAINTIGFAQPSKPLTVAKTAREMAGSVRGIVRTADGKPAANASVWVVAIYFANSPRHCTFSTQTDAKGMYQFTQLPYPNREWESDSVGLLIFAKTKHRPISKTTLTDTTGKATAPDISVREANASVSLSIRTATGSSASRVAVMLIAKDDHFPLLGPGNSMEAYGTLLDQLRPRALTDADGKVRFPHLLAGQYRVVVTKTMEQLEAINRGNIALVPSPPENFEQRFDLNLPTGSDTPITYSLSNN